MNQHSKALIRASWLWRWAGAGDGSIYLPDILVPYFADLLDICCALGDVLEGVAL